MQEQKVHGRPARHRPRHPHHAPRGVKRQNCSVFTALDRPFVGLSDGRIYDPRSGCALDWWGTGRPQIGQALDQDVWEVEFADGAALCTPNGIQVTAAPTQGQLRVQRPPQTIARPFARRWDSGRWVDLEPPFTRSRSRTLRREQRAGREPVGDGCPLLQSARVHPQEWPPPEPKQPNRW